MATSKQVAGMVGPTLSAVLISESPLVQPNRYDTQVLPVVYLSGVLMFVAGLAVVRAHNIWAHNWTMLVTVSGWVFLAVGLVRMFAPGQYREATLGAGSMSFAALEACFLLVALVITFKAYSRGSP